MRCMRVTVGWVAAVWLSMMLLALLPLGALAIAIANPIIIVAGPGGCDTTAVQSAVSAVHK